MNVIWPDVDIERLASLGCLLHEWNRRFYETRCDFGTLHPGHRFPQTDSITPNPAHFPVTIFRQWQQLCAHSFKIRK